MRVFVEWRSVTKPSNFYRKKNSPLESNLCEPINFVSADSKCYTNFAEQMNEISLTVSIVKATHSSVAMLTYISIKSLVVLDFPWNEPNVLLKYTKYLTMIVIMKCRKWTKFQTYHHQNKQIARLLGAFNLFIIIIINEWKSKWLKHWDFIFDQNSKTRSIVILCFSLLLHQQKAEKNTHI